MTLDYEVYQSPFTWRYGSPEMRRIWSEANKRKLWRNIWVVLAEVQSMYGLVSAEQLRDLQAHMDQVEVQRSLDIEAEIHHDLMAELKAFAESAPIGGGILHLGATSTDIEDNADVIRMAESLDLLLEKMSRLLLSFAVQIEKWADTPLIAFTHIQPAEPSTFGYRFACYAQDLLADWVYLKERREKLCGKGFKGAVGTGAAFGELLGESRLSEFEKRLSKRLGIPFYLVTTQVYPRKQDYQVMNALAGLGASLYKFAFDLRILGTPPIGEVGEPFTSKQVGSSAMPFKRNPIKAEKIDSLGRALAQMPRVAWDNAAHSLLERTLDDSANRRTLLPEGFLISDELLMVAQGIIDGLRVDEYAMERNLRIYAPFAALERVLMGLVKEGANRQKMHELLREHAMEAWRAIETSGDNPLINLLSKDERIIEYLPDERLLELMDPAGYLGDAPDRARGLADRIYEQLGEPNN